MNVIVKKLHENAIIPRRQTALASGFDLHALDVIRPGEKKPYDVEAPLFIMWPGQIALVRTGLAVQVTKGMEAQVRPRSGLALKHGITVLNSPGTVDADYTGDVGVILINHGQKQYSIRAGDRIAQLVFAPVHHETELMEVSFIDESERGGGGFGSTGKGVA
ncbi:deoxyuridine 5'-triphosphate nucleotidohydrolase [Desulfotomaculum arcticum]|uniref:dUTP diphosphatase n=1 Tax=Desulfotruncus arcticus DSM 17038 TaxID=1121424 RepID=A0A1I2Y9R9_9FIRM|nr:dUTP diphosphatase [Desulfotruncus arcticus]SFH22464.1 deoxyuridine 5'-triphosphate nucleotidohydrolase [Desulfotomaculum arcticum] [Desulfotruncus arcticus DSM 17038]